MNSPENNQPQDNIFTTSEMQYLATEDYELPPADPEFLALANHTLGEQLRAVELERDQLVSRVAELEKQVKNTLIAKALSDELIDIAHTIYRQLGMAGLAAKKDSLNPLEKLRYRAERAVSQSKLPTYTDQFKASEAGD